MYNKILCNDSLGEQPSFIYDENGKITGYTTKTGGAGTVFPFKSSLSNAIYTSLSCGTAKSASTIINIPSECTHAILNVAVTQGVGGRFMNNFSFDGDISNIKTIAEIDKYTSGKDQLLVYEFDTIPSGTINVSFTADKTDSYIVCYMPLLY